MESAWPEAQLPEPGRGGRQGRGVCRADWRAGGGWRGRAGGRAQTLWGAGARTCTQRAPLPFQECFQVSWTSPGRANTVWGGVRLLPGPQPFPGRESSRSPDALRPKPGWPRYSVSQWTSDAGRCHVASYEFSRAQEAEFSALKQGAQALQTPSLGTRGGGGRGPLACGFAPHDFLGSSRGQVPPVMELPASAVAHRPAGSAARHSGARA